MYHTAVQATFDRIRAARPGYTPWVGFVVQGPAATAVYTLEPSDRPDLPGTHKLNGKHGTTYGYWTEVSGRAVPVRRSGWYNTRGVLGTFDTRDTPNPNNDDPTLRVKGWAVTSTAHRL
jgi:hypothetical protein